MRLRSASRRHLGPWMEGPPHAVHTDTLELCVVLSGSSHLALDDTVRVLREGDVVLIPPGVVHSSWTEGSAAEELVLHLLAAGAPELQGVEAGVWPGDALGGVEPLCEARDPATQEAAAWFLVRRAGRERAAARHPDPRLDRLIAAVRADLERPWRLDAMAARAGMSPRSLRRAFHATLGQSPIAWLLGLRVQAAAHLLTTTRRSVADIAFAVGFGSPSRLSEAFARLRGISPSAWRARHTPEA